MASWRGGAVTNSLLSLSENTSGTQWEELLPPMPTQRARAAAVTTPNHLIVAGGRSSVAVGQGLLCEVEILNLESFHWSSASSSPQAFQFPHMTLCGEHLYLSENNSIFSCSVEELLKSCKPTSTNSSDGGSVWTKPADIPVPYDASLTTLRGQVLAIGGRDRGTRTGAIHQYNRSTNSWSVIGEMPTPHNSPLVAVLPSHELIVVGGRGGAGTRCNITEIASTE